MKKNPEIKKLINLESVLSHNPQIRKSNIKSNYYRIGISEESFLREKESKLTITNHPIEFDIAKSDAQLSGWQKRFSGCFYA